MNQNETQNFEHWAILELMGHRVIAGLVSEHQVAGKGFIRIEIPKTAEGVGDTEYETTQFYSPDAVYCITPTTESIARAYANNHVYRPVSEYEIRPRALPTISQEENGPWD